MSVQFPRDFGISDLLEIETTDLVKGFLRSLFAVHEIEMPMDGIAILQIFVAEKVKLMAANFIGLTNDLAGLLRKALTKQFQNRLH